MNFSGLKYLALSIFPHQNIQHLTRPNNIITRLFKIMFLSIWESTNFNSLFKMLKFLLKSYSSSPHMKSHCSFIRALALVVLNSYIAIFSTTKINMTTKLYPNFNSSMVLESSPISSSPKVANSFTHLTYTLFSQCLPIPSMISSINLFQQTLSISSGCCPLNTVRY